MSYDISRPGLLVLDSTLKPLAYNAEALQILTYPKLPDAKKQPQIDLADKVRSTLVKRRSDEGTEFVTSYTSGRRRYACRAFRLDSSVKPDSGEGLVILLERYTSSSLAFEETAQHFGLTEREIETVQLLVQGLTSKEIAARMHISPNTVKAFVRLAMLKMGVSTRSGISGKMFAPAARFPPEQ